MTPPDPETMPSSMQAPRFTETYIAEALSILRDIDHDDVEELVGHLALASTIYVCGLGGSAAHASHMANDLTKLRSEENTSELQSHSDLVCRLLLEKKKA